MIIVVVLLIFCEIISSSEESSTPHIRNPYRQEEVFHTNTNNHHQQKDEKWWTVCDVTQPPFNAIGDGIHKDTKAIQMALKGGYRFYKQQNDDEQWDDNDNDNDNDNINKSKQQQQGIHHRFFCTEILIPKNKTVLTGPFNLSSNQILTVDGTLLASTNKNDYPLIAPILGYGWSNDGNCFLKNESSHKIIVGALRYAPFIGSFFTTNITIRGIGTIDGQGQSWWNNCTLCNHHNISKFCEIATRPKLIEFQFVNDIQILGGGSSSRSSTSSSSSSSSLTLQNSPFWTVTSHYSQNIVISNLNIFAPSTGIGIIGNTDGVNLDSCRDDGIAIKSGLNGYGLNLAIPTENVIIDNITTVGNRGGIAFGSELSGGIRNITIRNSKLLGGRGLYIKPSVGRGGYIDNIRFQNIITNNSRPTHIHIGHDGSPLLPSNKFVPLISNIQFDNVLVEKSDFRSECHKANQSKCFNITCVDDDGRIIDVIWPDILPQQDNTYTCKAIAITRDYGKIHLPWPVCIPNLAPVNILRNYYNWGPTYGNYPTLDECQRICH